MKKRYPSAFIAAYILAILAGVIWQAGGVNAETTIKLNVNSHTTSTATMNNMKPGDKMHSEYTILNDGHEGFNYFVDFKFISGDVELYNILQMTLEKEGVIIYSGVMSDAAGRVSIGSLVGGEQSTLLMDVTFPWEAGNEYQGKATTVAFEFSASEEPGPSPEPSATPVVTATPEATASPSATPVATPAPDVTATPSATTEIPVQPTATATTPIVNVTPGQSMIPTPLPTPTATTLVGEISITEPPVPRGGLDNDDTHEPTASPDNESTTSSITPEPSEEVALPEDELPLGAPEAGNKLPDTAEPWYNLILGSLAIAIISIIVIRRLKSKG